MKNSLQKITLTFILISLIPVGFVVYELSSLNNNERMVAEAYRNQLDAILYSVNQYTDDVFSNWANRIDILLPQDRQREADSTVEANNLAQFSQMTAVQEVYISDLQGKDFRYQVGDTALRTQIDYAGLTSHLTERMKRLATYQRGGYRKIEAMDTLIQGRFIPVYFLLNEDGPYKFSFLLIDLPQFIQNVLAPKMQAVSQGKFIISAFDRTNNTLIYSTEDIHPGDTFTGTTVTQEKGSEVANKELWLLPGYYLAISMKDASITELVRTRLVTGLLIFVVLFLLLLSGLIFLYRNIRREILLSQAKSEFVSNVSHEIRTPLSLISMYAETLEMNRVPEARKAEYYSIISKETMRLSGIVNRILNFAQKDANKKKYEFKNVDLNKLCSDITDTYAAHLHEKGFGLEVKLAIGKLPVKADEPSVTEALINLLDNAVKYSSENKHISVRTGRDSDSIYVEVEDRGIGIAKVHQNHIFEQFYRVPTHNVHSAKGTGLGLTLVKKTMAAHKGRVEVRSTVDKGSTFRLCFPIFMAVKENEKPATHEA